MPRYCFTLSVRPERIAEYVARHTSVWPDMLVALRTAGWHNYSLHLRDDGLLVGYVEADDLAAAQAAMAATEVNGRWQAQMAEFFTLDAGHTPDRSVTVLTEIFHLDTQLAPIDDEGTPTR